jgi:hypothetical protein
MAATECYLLPAAQSFSAREQIAAAPEQLFTARHETFAAREPFFFSTEQISTARELCSSSREQISAAYEQSSTPPPQTFSSLAGAATALTATPSRHRTLTTTRQERKGKTYE